MQACPVPILSLGQTKRTRWSQAEAGVIQVYHSLYVCLVVNLSSAWYTDHSKQYHRPTHQAAQRAFNHISCIMITCKSSRPMSLAHTVIPHYTNMCALCHYLFSLDVCVVVCPPDVGNVAEKHLICQEQKWRNGIASSCWMMP